MANQSQKNNASEIPFGFGVGAVAGAALTYFLQTDVGEQFKKELRSELIDFKRELVERNLIPSQDMSGAEIISHAVSYVAEYLAEEEARHKRTKKPRRKKMSSALAKSRSSRKKKPKKFSGV